MALKKENQRILLTKRLLQEGLLRLLEVKELEKISVTELCREAGINRATFYNHYDSPLALLTDIEAGVTRKLESIATVSGSIEESVDQLERVCIYLKDNVQLFKTLSRCHVDNELAYTFQKISKHPIAFRAQDLDPACIHLVSTYLFTGCYFMIREWLMNDIDKTPREIAELTVSIINKEFI